MIVLRLLVVALTVSAVSCAQRRLGPAGGGHLIGLPLTTGPLLLLLGLDSGPVAAAQAASGAVIGQLSIAAFCGSYGLLAGWGQRPDRADRDDRTRTAQLKPVGHVLVGSLLAALIAAGVAITLSDVPAGPAVVVVAAVSLGLAAMIGPVGASGMSAPRSKPGHALQTLLRIGITEVVVGAVLGVSTLVGAAVAGLLSALPVMLAVMLPATQRADGADAAVCTARSTLVALPGTAAALFVVGAAVLRLGPWLSCGLALIVLVGLGVVAGAVVRVVDRCRARGLLRGGRV